MQPSHDRLAVIKLAVRIGLYTIGNAPFRLILQSLMMNLFQFIFGPDDPAGDAHYKRIRRNNLIFLDNRTGGNNGTPSDPGPCQDGGVHADQDMILNDTAVHAGTVADCYIVPIIQGLLSAT